MLTYYEIKSNSGMAWNSVQQVEVHLKKMTVLHHTRGVEGIWLCSKCND